MVYVTSVRSTAIWHALLSILVAQTALVAAVDLRTYLLVLPRMDQKISVEMSLIGFSCEWSKEELLQLSECNAGW